MNDLVHSIAVALNAHKSGNTYVANCPICRTGKPTLNIWIADDGKIGLRCYYSVLGKCHTIAQVFLLQSIGVDISMEDITNGKSKPSETWPEMWHGASPLDLTYVDEYLFRRGINTHLLPLWRDQIRCIDHLKHPSGPRLPAMVCLMKNCITNEEQAIHRTYLNPMGTGKTEIIPNKMTLGTPKGGVVKFGNPVNGVIAVGEGIETCLSAFLFFGINVWASTSVGGLLDLQFPNTVKEVWWLVDNDEPGYTTLEHAKKIFKNVKIIPMWPSEGYKDFNDELRGK